GPLADRDRDEVLEASDVICIPSLRAESCGVALVQALSVAHARVVAGWTRGYAETVAGHEEVLVDARRPALLAERLSEALATGPTEQERRWRAVTVARHMAADVGPRRLAVYERVVARRAADSGQ